MAFIIGWSLFSGDNKHRFECTYRNVKQIDNRVHLGEVGPEKASVLANRLTPYFCEDAKFSKRKKSKVRKYLRINRTSTLRKVCSEKMEKKRFLRPIFLFVLVN